MKLKGHRYSLYVSIACLLIAAYVLMGCATTAVRPNCADDSAVAAMIWKLRTGDRTYIVKSKAGDHGQAYAVINGKHTPLHVYPLFEWYVGPSKEDDMKGGKGKIYKTVPDFIWAHRYDWRAR